MKWSEQTEGYAFWSDLDANGHFDLDHMVPGTYDLAISGADQPEDLVVQQVKVDANHRLDLGTIAWPSEEHGQRLWQIGRFDRSVGEFHDGDNARGFQMFKRYPDAFPHDVDYSIGQSQPERVWNYAQWTLYSEHRDWRIHFNVTEALAGRAALTIGFASSQPAAGKKLTDLRVAVNGTEVAAIQLNYPGNCDGYLVKVDSGTAAELLSCRK